MSWTIFIIAFLGANLDFFLILLLLLQRFKLNQVIIGYLSGVLLLTVLSYLCGQVIAKFLPEWLLGILGIWPIWTALHDDDDEVNAQSTHAPWLTVMTTYLSVCIGCNLSIMLPVLIKASFVQFLEVLIFIVVCINVIVYLLKLVGSVKPINNFINNYSEILTKIVYIGVGLYVFWDSGLISHLVTLF